MNLKKNPVFSRKSGNSQEKSVRHTCTGINSGQFRQDNHCDCHYYYCVTANPGQYQESIALQLTESNSVGEVPLIEQEELPAPQWSQGEDRSGDQ
jgi:hypothetical protein